MKRCYAFHRNSAIDSGSFGPRSLRFESSARSPRLPRLDSAGSAVRGGAQSAGPLAAIAAESTRPHATGRVSTSGLDRRTVSKRTVRDDVAELRQVWGVRVWVRGSSVLEIGVGILCGFLGAFGFGGRASSW